MKSISMTEGAPWKHILKFAFPVFAGSILQQLYNTVDSIVVGNFSGEDSLAAVGTTSTITFLFIAIALGFANGNGVLVAQYFGAKDEARVKRASLSGILLLFAFGVIMTILGVVLANPIFKYWVDVPEKILPETLSYFKIYSLGLFFQFGYNIFAAQLRGVGDSAATLYFLLISSVLNIALDLLFVAKLGMGVNGAAIATVISQLAAFIASYLYMVIKYPIFRFKLKDLSWDKSMVKRTMVIGTPMTLQLVVVSMGLTFIMRAVNGFGKVMTASFTVGNRIEMYLNLPFNAFQTTLATFVGQNIGAGKPDRAKKGTWQAIGMSFALSVLIAILIFIYAEPIIKIFGISDEAMVLCKQHVKAIALVNLLLSAYIPLFGAFQGAGNSFLPMIVVICALSLRVAATYIFRYSPVFGQTIIWWNGLFGFSVGLIISWIFFLSGKWLKKKIS